MPLTCERHLYKREHVGSGVGLYPPVEAGHQGGHSVHPDDTNLDKKSHLRKKQNGLAFLSRVNPCQKNLPGHKALIFWTFGIHLMLNWRIMDHFGPILPCLGQNMGLKYFKIWLNTYNFRLIWSLCSNNFFCLGIYDASSCFYINLDISDYSHLCLITTKKISFLLHFSYI